MHNITNLALINDILALPKDILSDICTDLNLESEGNKAELARRIFRQITQDITYEETALDRTENYILAGKTACKWYKLRTPIERNEFIDKIIEENTFNPFETMNIPNSNNLTSNPVLIAGACGLNNSEVYLRFMYRSGVKHNVYGTDITEIPSTSLSTVYYNDQAGIIEVRGDTTKAKSIITEIAQALKQQVNIEPVEALYNSELESIADSLNGELIDATSKPEMILEDFDEEKVNAIGKVLSTLDNYFLTSDSESLINSLEEANSSFGDQQVSLPFSALILSGMDKVGLASASELRSLPLFDYLSPSLNHYTGFIKFPFAQGGVTKYYTIRVGRQTRSIYFNTPTNEEVIQYVRQQVIL